MKKQHTFVQGDHVYALIAGREETAIVVFVSGAWVVVRHEGERYEVPVNKCRLIPDHTIHNG